MVTEGFAGEGDERGEHTSRLLRLIPKLENTGKCQGLGELSSFKVKEKS